MVEKNQCGQPNNHILSEMDCINYPKVDLYSWVYHHNWVRTFYISGNQSVARSEATATSEKIWDQQQLNHWSQDSPPEMGKNSQFFQHFFEDFWFLWLRDANWWVFLVVRRASVHQGSTWVDPSRICRWAIFHGLDIPREILPFGLPKDK